MVGIRLIQKAILICLITILSILASSCTKSIESDLNGLVRLQPLAGNARNINLWIYNKTNNVAAGEVEIEGEGSLTISPDMLVYDPEARDLFVVARATGYFAELYFCDVGEKIKVDLDSLPSYGNTVAATIFVKESWYGVANPNPYHYYTCGNFEIPLADGSSPDFTTDSKGRFAVGNLPDGVHVIRVKYENMTHLLSVGLNGNVEFFNGHVSYAPNIYLYPGEITNVRVELGFPSGGHIIESEPEYGSGWNVSVDSNGIIDCEYNYLFYEASLPPLNNYKYGWIFDRNDLGTELPILLSDLGYQGREIDDFLEFWLPVLNRTQYYAFFPQDADRLTTLEIDPIPETVIRQLLYVEPLDSRIYLPEPIIPEHPQRHGFIAVEWGLIGSPDLLE